jgi:Tol biopolymer transport system component
VRKVVGFLFLVVLLVSGSAALAAGRIELLSKADPVPDVSGTSFLSGISADGRYVLFQSEAPNLAPGQADDNRSVDLFLRDRVAGITTLVSHAAGKPNVAGHVPEPIDSSLFTPPASLSADGRYAAFVSLATDLVPGLVNPRDTANLFLYDRVTGTNTLISHVSGDASTAAGGFVDSARISADGAWVVFTSSGNDLVPGQAPSAAGTRFNVFLYDRLSGAVALISHRSGAPATGSNGDATSPEISADGGSVAFVSQAGDLIPGQADARTQSVFLYQRATGALTLVSHGAGSTLAPPNSDSGSVRMSADGRFLGFLSLATNLIAGQVPTASTYPQNAFLYDRTSGELRLVSHTTASPQTPAFAGSLALSADGRYLAFDSAANDVVPGQANSGAQSNLFVYDRVAGAISLASHGQGSATTPASGGSGGASLSADGRYIAYVSEALDLVPHQTDAPNTFDVFVYDRTTRAAVLASHVRGSLTTAANGRSISPLISADGGTVAFDSYATDLAEGQTDLNGYEDVFVLARSSAEVTALSEGDSGQPSITPLGLSSSADLSADGRYAVFVSTAAGLVPGQVDTPDTVDPFTGERHGTFDVFLRDRATGKTTLLSRAQASPPTSASGFTPAISADGKFVAFVGLDHSGSPNPLGRLYVYDRVADALILANHGLGTPGQPDGLPRNRPAISADGRYVAYTCSRCHLVPGQQDGDDGHGQGFNVFLYDRVTGANTLVSHASGLPTTTGDLDSQEPRISADGGFVLFTSQATDLVAGQAGSSSSQSLFLYDRATGAIALVDHAAGSPATVAGGYAFYAALSADGRWVVFRSRATGLVPGQIDTNGLTDVFLYDRAAGTTVLVSHAASSPVTAGSADLDYYPGEEPLGISADGHWIVFTSQAADLVAGLNPGEAVVTYLYDRTTGQVTVASSAAGSPNSARDSLQPGISADGRRITFLSRATDVVPGQSPGSFLNLFVVDRITGERAVAGRVGSLPNGVSINISAVPRLSADGLQIAFSSLSSLVAGDFNGTWDAYLYDAAGSTGPVTVPPCGLFNGALRSGARKVLAVAGHCGVPAGAKQALLKLTVSRGTANGNVQIYPGNVANPSSGILRFNRGMTRSASFTVSLGNGGIALLPFVAGNGTVRLGIEVDGYVP